MYFFSKQLKKATTALLASAISVTLVSCGDKEEQKPEEKPVKQPPKRSAPAVPATPPVDALDDFRTPQITLPRNAQLSEGAESSIGKVATQAPPRPDSAPSTAIKPPAPAPKPDEDQLDPGP